MKKRGWPSSDTARTINADPPIKLTHDRRFRFFATHTEISDDLDNR